MIGKIDPISNLPISENYERIDASNSKKPPVIHKDTIKDNRDGNGYDS
jgi:hypothetical protein